MHRVAATICFVLVAGLVFAANNEHSNSSLAAPTRTDRLHGSWVPHPSVSDELWPSTIPAVNSNPKHDNLRLTFREDGSVSFTGTIHSVYVNGVPVDDEQTDFKSRPLQIRGKWDFSGNFLSIVTDAPAIYRWEVLAITDNDLVLRTVDSTGSPQTSPTHSDKPVDMFWRKVDPERPHGITK